MNKYLVAGFILVFLLAGCSSRTDDTNQSNNRGNTTSNNEQGETITLDRAREIALADVDGEVTKQQEDYDDGQLYFEIDIVKDGIKYEYKIDASGNIVGKEQENISQNGNVSDAYISAQEAQEIIVQHAGGGTVTKCELEIEGTAVYEIDLVKDNQEYEAIVNATTGEVLQYQADY